MPQRAWRAPLSLLLLCLGVQNGFCLGIREKEAGSPYFSTTVRVLLDRESQDVAVRSQGEALYFKPVALGSWTPVGREAHLGLRKEKKRFQLLINDIPLASDTVEVRGGVGAKDVFEFKTHPYRGNLVVRLEGDTLLTTNNIPLEDYLEGTVGSEMNPNWELEALKAQVVASRSYVLYMMRNPRSPLFDVDKTTQDQVYTGVEKLNEAIQKAVKSTWGEYLGVDKKPVKAYFHSRCGGTTETAESVWQMRNDPNHKRVPCPYCHKFPFVWKASLSIAE